MERHSMVMTVSVDHDGQSYHADYFVHDDIIHANLDGHIVRIPRGAAPAEETVRTMLAGRLAHRARRFSNVGNWAPAVSQGAR